MKTTILSHLAGAAKAISSTCTRSGRFVLTLLVVLLSSFTARATTFVTDVKLIGGSRSETTVLKDALIDDGWKLVDYDLMVLVLRNIISCLKEMICQGQPVKLDGLGTFYPSIEGTGSSTVEKYDPNSNIKGVHLRYLPEGGKDDNITSRKLKDECVFEMNDYVQTFTKTIDGKQKSYQVRKKISTLAIENAEADTAEP